MTSLVHEPIDVDKWRRQAVDPNGGASVEFLGIVRATEGDRPIAWLDYEAYEAMAERMIARLVEEAKRRWSVHAAYVRHRVGRVAAGEVAVLIGVQAPHRDEAFEACRFLIDAIKREAPIWKTRARFKTSVGSGLGVRGSGSLVAVAPSPEPPAPSHVGCETGSTNPVDTPRAP